MLKKNTIIYTGYLKIVLNIFLKTKKDAIYELIITYIIMVNDGKTRTC
jgi:hypothetical protein